MKIRLKVRHYEVDAYGHVNHANYVHYFEVARVEALDTLGLSLDEMRRQGYLLVAAEIVVKFHSPARSGESLDITTEIREIRGARSLWVQEMREAGSERLVATAEVTGALMTEGGHPVRIPATFRAQLSTLSGPSALPTAPAGDPAGRGEARNAGRFGAPIRLLSPEANPSWCAPPPARGRRRA